jgi:lipopolysaccharide/colanic/teichoic acid biosynthesis glycosyltransferase
MKTREYNCQAEPQIAEAVQCAPRWKRVLDMICIVLTAPGWVTIMAVIAGLIKIVSPGPVFFRQERVGYRGRRFICLKFRSMKVNASSYKHQEHLSGLIASDRPMEKMDSSGDARLIPLGALLRSSGLDELPQLFNVWRGDMSLVGPRPCVPYEYEQYRPWQRERFDALPGLTGLWQVSGKNKTTFTQMILLDISYVRTQSLWLDLSIMARTFSALAEQVSDLWASRASQAAAAHPVLPGAGQFAQAVPEFTGK